MRAAVPASLAATWAALVEVPTSLFTPPPMMFAPTVTAAPNKGLALPTIPPTVEPIPEMAFPAPLLSPPLIALLATPPTIPAPAARSPAPIPLGAVDNPSFENILFNPSLLKAASTFCLLKGLASLDIPSQLPSAKTLPCGLK